MSLASSFESLESDNNGPQNIPVAIAERIGDVVKPLDHPLAERMSQEIVAHNNWVKLNRGWTLVSSKYTLANKLPIISLLEHYTQAAVAANASFIEEIRLSWNMSFASSLC